MSVFIDQDLNIQVILGDLNSLGKIIFSEKTTITEVKMGTDVKSDTSGNASGEVIGDASGNMYGEVTGATTKDPLLSSWPAVIGLSSVTLVISIVLGILLAKRKIKKGFELYED